MVISMKKWEYKIIDSGTGILRPNRENLEKELDELGANGWEFVCTVLGQNIVLKRELK